MNKKLLIGAAALVASAPIALPMPAAAAGQTIFISGCQVIQNAGQSAANASTAVASTYIQSGQGCSGAKVRLGYAQNGGNFITGAVQDTSSAGQYNAVVERSNATARYIESQARKDGSWSGWKRFNV